MKIKLLDYAGQIHKVEIDDTTDYICGEIVSGDTIMEYPFHYDTGEGRRIMNFYDGSFLIPASKFVKMNKITNSYQLFDLQEESYEDVDSKR